MPKPLRQGTRRKTQPGLSDFGQGGADLMGSGMNGVSADTVNGSQFTENSQVASATGGIGEIAYIAKYIAQVGVAAATKTIGAQAVQWFQGLTSTTSSNVNDLHQGIWSLANGQSGNAMSIISTANAAMQAILNGTAGAGGSSTSSMLVQAIQAVASAVKTVGSAVAGAASSLSSLKPSYQLPGAVGGASSYSPTLQINQNNTLTANGVQQIDQINQMLGTQLTTLARTNRYATTA